MSKLKILNFVHFVFSHFCKLRDTLLYQGYQNIRIVDISKRYFCTNLVISGNEWTMFRSRSRSPVRDIRRLGKPRMSDVTSGLLKKVWAEGCYINVYIFSKYVKKYTYGYFYIEANMNHLKHNKILQR